MLQHDLLLSHLKPLELQIIDISNKIGNAEIKR